MPKVPRTKKHAKAVTDLVKKPKGHVDSPQKSTTPKQNCPEQQILEMLREKYSTNRNAKNAVAMKKYMRGQFEYFGLQSPARRALDKEVLQGSPVLEVEKVWQLLHLLWQEKEREFQMFGIDYGGKNLKILIGNDLQTSTASLECVKQLIETQSWWDTVDMLASKLVGGLVAAHPAELGREMDKWINDENMWVRRSAILHQLNYNQNTDEEKLFRYCLLRCQEREFFIEKAIGWALRNYFRYNKSAVKKFVAANKDKLAKLSVREALKHA